MRIVLLPRRLLETWWSDEHGEFAIIPGTSNTEVADLEMLMSLRLLFRVRSKI
jgi:hypothetical protein